METRYYLETKEESKDRSISLENLENHRGNSLSALREDALWFARSPNDREISTLYWVENRRMNCTLLKTR
jgi:hypothetical protein